MAWDATPLADIARADSKARATLHLARFLETIVESAS
jgi:hypothetical protein